MADPDDYTIRQAIINDELVPRVEVERLREELAQAKGGASYRCRICGMDITDSEHVEALCRAASQPDAENPHTVA